MPRPSVERIGRVLLLALAACLVVAVAADFLGDRVVSTFLAELLGTATLPCLGVWLVGYGSRSGKTIYLGLGWVLIVMGIVFVINKIGQLSGLWSL